MQKRRVEDRVLARVLAEDLRNVLAGTGGGNVLPDGATSTVTDGPRPDITNVGGDGDAQ